MKSIYPVLRLWQLTYLRWALAEICPLHPDVPYIVNRINEIERS